MNRIIKSVLWSFSMMLSIAACQANPQPHLSHDPTWWSVPAGLSWMWQLQDYEHIKINPEIDVYDVDLFEASEGGAQSLIRKLKSANKKVICYFSAGTREDWRSDAGDFLESAVIADGEMDDWPGEVWLNIANRNALENNIQPIMAKRLDLAAASGCDGVEPDNVDAYANVDETHGLISPDDQLRYNRWLSQAAHQRGLAIGLKNDMQQLDALVDDFDFAVNEQCYAYGIECVNYEGTFLAKGKAVFNQEYYTDGQEGEIDESTFTSSACPYFQSVGISSLWKSGYALDGGGVTSCPEKPNHSP
ncbi:endo alpha-1,4 polygalactosaminidase [Vibrio spartinae]|uniref:Glycoside-hydrolase family GH114 TIM-barrel domain-containing protein n=1 Tax=Vibrio spartinae TaxID=1918945 RepID=A0A1N6M8R2_9VIBR|nr:endo alpha-1,4 polygalactosaminidase [Vibrio spartinae]SIO95832.1 hypothetical protein VSP9026_03584 [Vibrio spartinae]